MSSGEDYTTATAISASRVEYDGTPITRDPIALRLAVAWQRLAPRAKAAGARLIGRCLLGDRLFSTDTNKGFTLVGCRQSIDMIAFQKSTGGWSDHVYRACLAQLHTNSVIYDIGANAGYFTLGAAMLKLPGLQVVSFEPLPMLARTVAAAANVNRCDNVRVYGAALADRVGSRRLWLSPHSIHASFVPRTPRSLGAIHVPTFSLDAMVEAAALPLPTVIKMDVEGAESLVMRGAAGLLSGRHPTLIFECDDNSLRFGHTPADLLAQLRELGYREFYKLEKEGSVKLEPREFLASGFGDFLARV